MKRIFLFAIVAVLIGLMTSCISCDYNNASEDNSVKISKKYGMPYFNKIILSAPCNVHYIQCNRSMVKIVGHNDFVKKVVVSCSGETLNVSMKNNDVLSFIQSHSYDMDVYIYSNDIIDIQMKGSGDFIADNQIDSDTLNIALTGSGDLEIKDIICDKMTISLMGVGDINIGKLFCSTSELNLSGNGDLNVKLDRVKKSYVTLKGNGDINVKGENCGEIDCKLFGNGDIDVNGNFYKVDKSIRGNGDISVNK